MGGLQHGRWLMLGAALVVVFVAALSMRVQQVGWSFFILCFVVGSFGRLESPLD